MFWPRSCPSRRKTAPRGIAKRRFCCYLRRFGHIASFAPFGCLGAVLGLSCHQLGPSMSTFGPQKGPKIGPKSCSKQGPKTEPEKLCSTCRKSPATQPHALLHGWGWGVPSVGPAGYILLALLNSLASTSLPFVLGFPSAGGRELRVTKWRQGGSKDIRGMLPAGPTEGTPQPHRCDKAWGWVLLVCDTC